MGNSIAAPKAYKTVSATVSNTVADINTDFGLTLAELDGSNEATISTTQPINITMDGVALPTATVGVIINAGSAVTINGASNIKKLKFIRTSANDATVTVVLWD